MSNVSLADGHIDEPKMTDEQIIKALECCGVKKDCAGCPKEKEPYGCYFVLCGGAFNLIERLQAEIERLRYILVNFMGEIFEWGNKNDVDTRIFAQIAILGKEKDEAVKQIKSEARKEFAERLEVYKQRGTVHGVVKYITDIITIHDVGNLLEEMEESK